MKLNETLLYRIEIILLVTICGTQCGMDRLISAAYWHCVVEGILLTYGSLMVELVLGSLQHQALDT